MKKVFRYVIPWLITLAALYFAFRDVEWWKFIEHIGEASTIMLLAAVGLTCLSYLLRSFRWQHLFPTPVISFANAVQVLILGFFMNNILPARAGEFVRAHMGAQVTGEKRTLVLATIASERLADGITISLMFVLFAIGLGDEDTSTNLMYVAYLFAFATVAVAIVLVNRAWVFALAEKVHQKFDNRTSQYTANRIQVFLNGLSPLYSWRTLPMLVISSIVIWGVELAAYYFIQLGFNAGLTPSQCVLFLVVVNFASLVPAAPGAIGVIEAAGSAVLVSTGVPREQALTMVISQHLIQYLVVGIPGAIIMSNWKKTIQSLGESAD